MSLFCKMLSLGCKNMSRLRFGEISRKNLEIKLRFTCMEAKYAEIHDISRLEKCVFLMNGCKQLMSMVYFGISLHTSIF